MADGQPPVPPSDAGALPSDCPGLDRWMARELPLGRADREAVVACVGALLARERRHSEQSKAASLNALVRTCADQIEGLRREISERDATVSSLASHFEQVVADLTRRANRDPKTQLMNFTRFAERLELLLATEQRGQWCAIGLVDVTSFKWFNDTLGHPVGDVIIERVAQLLQQHVRSHDIVAHSVREDLHARFGGDEFCFFIPHLTDPSAASAIANRFGAAVMRHDWAAEHHTLGERPITVDIGVACFELGPVAVRRTLAGQLARDLVAHADRMMYAAKNDRSDSAYVVSLSLQDGVLIPAAAMASTP